MRSSEKLVTRTLELLDTMYRLASADGASRDEVREATRLHLEVLSYIKPKLQAIAPAQMEEDGSLIALQVRRIADQVEEQRLLTS